MHYLPLTHYLPNTQSLSSKISTYSLGAISLSLSSCLRSVFLLTFLLRSFVLSFIRPRRVSSSRSCFQCAGLTRERKIKSERERESVGTEAKTNEKKKKSSHLAHYDVVVVSYFLCQDNATASARAQSLELCLISRLFSQKNNDAALERENVKKIRISLKLKSLCFCPVLSSK